VALGKLLDLGGIDNSPSKARQDTGKFRVARNVYPTPDNRLIPRYHNSLKTNLFDVKCYHNILQYDSSVLELLTRNVSGVYRYELYKDGIKIPRSTDISASPFTTRTEDYPQQVQTNRFNNVVYYLSPYDGTLIKYDGVELGYAGVHQPVFSCAQAGMAVPPNTTKYIRVIQHRLDFESTLVWSEDVLFPTPSATTAIKLRTDGGADNILEYGIGSVGSKLGIVTPKIADDNYYKSTIINYVTTLPASGNYGEVYAVLSTNVVSRWNGTSWETVYSAPFLSYATFSLFPAVGQYEAIYKDVATGLFYAWKTSSKATFSYNTLGDFPAIGSATAFYIAKDTQLIYKYSGGIYVLVPNAGEYVNIVNGSINNGVWYNYNANEINIVSFDTNISDEKIGSYVIIDPASGINTNLLGVTSEWRIIAYKIKSVTELSGKVRIIALDGLDVRGAPSLEIGFSSVNTDKYQIVEDPSFTSSVLNKGSRTFFSVWASPSQDGTFTQKGFVFSFPDSSVAEYTANIDVTTATITTAVIPSAIVTAGELNSVFSFTSPPISLNENTTFYGINSRIYCMTNFAGVLCFSSDNYLFTSHLAKPVMTEMISTAGIISIGDLEEGRYTNICGTSDFLFLSRERKNYYITGNLFTGNYRIQNITEAEVGSWGNSTSIAVKDSVIFLTSKGIYQTVEGARTVLLSVKCPKNFPSFDAMNVNEDVSFKISGLLANIGITAADNSICLAYDEYRDLLVFMQKNSENPCLVFCLKNKEFYEWDGMLKTYANQYGNCITFINSEYLIGGITPTNNTARSVIENKTSNLSYVVTNPVKLYTTWLTAGEPSLEKSLLQLKIFGRIQSNGTTSSVSVCHYKDWDLSKKITNSEYFPLDTSGTINSQVQYSHKKRLNSDKILSASVGLEINTFPVTFELESMEVELNSIQEGMKR